MTKQICNLDAERALLGSVLIDQALLDTVALEAEDFFLDRNQTLWRTFKQIKRQGGVVEFVTVMDRLNSSGQVESMGGPTYLMDLINSTPSSIYAEQYAQIIREKSERRQLVRAAEQLATAAYDDEADISQARTAVVEQIIRSQSVRSGARPVAEYLSGLYDDILARYENPQDVYGVTSGFPDFDTITGGLQRGEVFMLSGEPGVGKSILGMQWAFAGAKAGHPAAIYEMEMGSKAFLRRELSGRSGVQTHAMKSGRLKDAEWQGLVAGIAAMERLPVYVDFGTHWNTNSLRADLTRLKLAGGVEVVVIDYLDYLTDRAANENERTATISRSLHNIAKDLDVALVTINSMNKTGMEATRPTQSNLSGSSKLAYDADMIAFLTQHIPESGQPLKNVRTLSLAKNREGEKSFMHLVKRDGFPAFESYAKAKP